MEKSVKINIKVNPKEFINFLTKLKCLKESIGCEVANDLLVCRSFRGDGLISTKNSKKNSYNTKYLSLPILASVQTPVRFGLIDVNKIIKLLSNFNEKEITLVLSCVNNIANSIDFVNSKMKFSIKCCGAKYINFITDDKFTSMKDEISKSLAFSFLLSADELDLIKKNISLVDDEFLKLENLNNEVTISDKKNIIEIKLGTSRQIEYKRFDIFINCLECLDKDEDYEVFGTELNTIFTSKTSDACIIFDNAIIEDDNLGDSEDDFDNI